MIDTKLSNWILDDGTVYLLEGVIGNQQVNCLSGNDKPRPIGGRMVFAKKKQKCIPF